jgi:hypothetical protein
LIYGYNGNTNGFTFQQYSDEIDAGNPVFIHVRGHTMLGVGYDDSTSTIYIHDTWDYSTHSMTWGGSYSFYSLNQVAVTVVKIEKALSLITISGAVTIDKNTSSQYVCTATYSDGSSSNVTATTTWSENSNYASISSGGLLTATEVSRDQNVTIIASYTEDGITKQDTHLCVVNDVFDIRGPNGYSVTNGEAASTAAGTDFGYCTDDLFVTNQFSISNCGSSDFVISGIVTSGVSASSFEVIGIPTCVSGGSDSNFYVIFDTSVPGDYTASLSIANNSSNSPYVVNLSGSAYFISSDNGPAVGGNSIIITYGLIGSGLDITNVTVGGVSATITGQGIDWVEITVPAGMSGTKDIVITSTSVGTNTLAEVYTYNPAGWIADPSLVSSGPYIAGEYFHSLAVSLIKDRNERKK